MKNLAKILLVTWMISSVALFSACVSTSGNKTLAKKSEQDILADIVKGKTTKAEIEKIFGKPNGTGFQSDGSEVWHYTYGKGTTDAASYIPVVGVFAGSSKVETKSLNVVFDKKGVAKDYTISSSSNTQKHIESMGIQ